MASREGDVGRKCASTVLIKHQASGRMELERPRFVPANWPSSWAQHIYSRMTGLSQDSLALKVWLPWAERVNKLCEEEVRGNFDKHIEPLVRTIAEKPRDYLPIVLSDAGIDCADHQASLRFLLGLVKESFPSACAARLGPQDFRTRALAVRRMLEQFMPHTKSTQVTVEVDDEGDGEWLGDLPQSSRASSKDATLMGFVDWYLAERMSKPERTPIVLLIEQVETVPKTTLNEILTSLRRACCRKKFPIIVYLGMGQPPQSRHHLFEKEFGFGNLEDAIPLFRGQRLGRDYLEEFSQSHFPGLRISPSVLQWLRDQQTQNGGAITALLNNMQLMVQEHLLQKGFLAQLIASSPTGTQKEGERQRHFISKVRLSSTEKLRALWKDAGETVKGDFETIAGKACADVSNWLLNPSETELEGVQRALLHEATVDEAVKDGLRKHAYCGQLYAESLLLPLVVGRQTSDQPSDDLTFLGRLMQASVGRRLQVAELWTAFLPHAKCLEAQARQRFGVALSGLQALGLFTPQAPSGASKQKEVSWRLQKRHFGRLWVGSKKRAKRSFALEPESLERLEAIVDAKSGLDAPMTAPARQVGMLKSTAAWSEALRRKLRANQGRKRQLIEDQEGRRIQKKEKRPRIYMGN